MAIVSTNLQGRPATDGCGVVVADGPPARADHADGSDPIALLDLHRAARLEHSAGEYPALLAAAGLA